MVYKVPFLCPLVMEGLDKEDFLLGGESDTYVKDKYI